MGTRLRRTEFPNTPKKNAAVLQHAVSSRAMARSNKTSGLRGKDLRLSDCPPWESLQKKSLPAEWSSMR